MKAEQVVASNVRFRDCHPGRVNSREELLRDLTKLQKTINPKYFYDAKGSALFERITTLPEYYPTRTERDILIENVTEICACCGSGCILIEPGSGSSEKVRLLLEALQPAAYIPLDISSHFLLAAAKQLSLEYSWLPIYAISADFSEDWHLPDDMPEGRPVIFYPGSTIGNLEPDEALHFLQNMREWMGVNGAAVIGVDRHKSTATLCAAYNDSKGVTAAFNRNVLHNVNAILGADFVPDSFEHRAFYNVDLQRIEMHLVSRLSQQVNLGSAVINFSEGEAIHTENSYKYTPEQFSSICGEAGLTVSQHWSDAGKLFSVYYLTPTLSA